MMAKKLILLLIFSMFINFSHLITLSTYIPLNDVAISPAYNYKSTLNSSIALTVLMRLGTPPQLQRMVLDTGSQLSWVQCRRKDPSFNSNASSSFSEITCNDEVCTTNANQMGNPSISMNCLDGRCRYSYSFSDGAPAEGNLVREKFNFSSSQVTPSLIIGCSPKKDAMSGANGMLGMNRGKLSFISQVNGSRFLYCVPLHVNVLNSSSSVSDSNGATGTFYLGDNPKSNSFGYTNLLNTSQQGQLMADFDPLAYYVSLVHISINGKNRNCKKILNGTKVVNLDASCEIMIDSGTRHTYLVDAVYNAVRERVVNLIGRHIKDKEMNMVVNQFDMCFKLNSNWSDIEEKIGDIVFEFENGVKISIPKKRTLDYINDEVGVCVAIGRSEWFGAATNILGYFFQQNYCLDFDIQRNRVGFGNADGSS